MKSLGKQDVLVESFLDGEKTSSKVESRVVYQDSKGSLLVNWFAGGKREITQRPDGSFYWRIDIRSIPARSFQDVIGALPE
jgi:hypothetical protein